MVIYGAEHPSPHSLSVPLLERAARQHWGLTTPLTLKQGPYGKPFFPDDPDHHFNISHRDNTFYAHWMMPLWVSIFRSSSRAELLFWIESVLSRRGNGFDQWAISQNPLQYYGVSKKAAASTAAEVLPCQSQRFTCLFPAAENGI